MKTVRLAMLSAVALGLAMGVAAAQDAFSASNAKLDGEQLTLDITSPQAGWAVIHKIDDEGKAGDHIGHAAIKAGENKGVQITLDQPVEGDQLIVMLHDDAGKKGEFEFGADSKVDAPVMEDGKPVTDEIDVSE